MKKLDKTPNLLASLKQVSMFGSLQSAELAVLFDLCEIREYEDVERIISQGEFSSNLFAILEGAVQILVRSDEGEDISLAKLRQGDVFGETAIFQEVARTADVVAKGRTVIVSFTRNALVKFMNDHPLAGNRILTFIIFSLIHKLRSTNNELVLEKQSTVSANDLERLTKLFPSTMLSDMLEEDGRTLP